MRRKNLSLILLGIIFFSTLSLANTSQASVAGFDNFARYLSAFLRFIKFVGYAVGAIYFIVKLIEFIFNPQWDQMGKTILTFVLIMGGIFAIDTIVRAVGGTTIDKNVEKIKVVKLEKIKFLGEANERK
ncbi:hypothetical protein [Streptobacillus moniliformis]|uniref:Uncharacterized protein n=1 Tax=Streptobacillus moniliformis (strain ATCC 14647 / DSM 12112 / NCTC 10651 / 9901) TaxID=519441 RepID=D1AYJ0_STRM9|nr:hypothetical protein [Streptobacillus moniliformis]ACZ01366.1 hypothetical protein Smon_0899 [Streptobacillus moniliformis DSM 12112]AVL43620.1 hypothetical protein CEP89_07355 [Streptobacillus moniliformis]SQA13476.1 Uncharacterised protein [Streptobacillus moniliformis]SQA14570.1 Uncharacterised protein [Streptobacillus moniliformis]